MEVHPRNPNPRVNFRDSAIAVFSIYRTNLAGLPCLNSQNIGIIYAYSQVA